MVQIEFMPDLMKTAANPTPHAWAMDGLRSLITSGADSHPRACRSASC
jgi:hypothetical protein